MTDAPPSGTPEAEAETARERALKSLREAREYAEYKSLGDGRIISEEKEHVRIKYLQTVIKACNAERHLLKDRDLDELADHLDRIEESRERAKYR